MKTYYAFVLFVIGFACYTAGIFILSYQLHTLDSSYTNTLPDIEVEPCITVVEAIPLHTQASLVHFEGKVVGASKPWPKGNEYDITFPQEIRDGYLTLIAERVDKSTYLLWTENNAFNNAGADIKFWGFTDSIHRLENMNIIYPMVKSK